MKKRWKSPNKGSFFFAYFTTPYMDKRQSKFRKGGYNYVDFDVVISMDPESSDITGLCGWNPADHNITLDIMGRTDRFYYQKGTKKVGTRLSFKSERAEVMALLAFKLYLRKEE